MVDDLPPCSLLDGFDEIPHSLANIECHQDENKAGKRHLRLWLKQVAVSSGREVAEENGVASFVKKLEPYSKT
ncbi:hypothetical protein HHK36_013709 [Tetracentron sinense]|uniref:Uncharacterized protein n=1 Tax=Tetracentron sinense TaxID=13715 RepID=A0A835DEP1_TETSI|nr:hypothetical protein HHK36_013709 [Tetracentron sinense]